MKQTMRPMGLDCLQEAPWGTHLCHLYETSDDLYEILIPFFRAGIQSNEYCIWVCSEPLTEESVRARLALEFPGIDLGRQFEVVMREQHQAWRAEPSTETILTLWSDWLAKAARRGFIGIRSAGNTSWITPDNLPALLRYQDMFYGGMGACPMTSVCSYPLDKCGISEILQLASSHETVLLKKDGRWQAIKSNKRKSDEWEALFDSVPEALLIVDQYGVIVGINERASELLCLDFSTGSPITLADVSARLHLAPNDPTAQADLTHAFPHDTQSGLSWHATIDGKTLSLEITSRKIADDVTYQRYMLILSDVTKIEDARRVAQREAKKFTELVKAIKCERDMWRNVFDEMPVGVAIFDESGELLESNRANMNLYGLDARLESEFLPVRLKFPDGKAVPDEERPTQRILNGEEIVGFEALVDTADGGPADLLISGGKLVSGGQQRFYWVSHDITELRKLQRAKDDFMMVVSHELRNPLQVITGLVQLLSRKPGAGPDPKHATHLATLKRQVLLLNSMVEDILAAYQLGARKLSVEMDDVEIVALMSEVVTPYTNDLTHEVLLTLPPNSSATIRGDRQRLAQILENLLSNALKYTPEGKRIWVRLEVHDTLVMVIVEDEGIGIPEAEQELVFQGFHRAHKFGEWKSGGVGLGLYISRQLARRHGGDLWAEQRAGSGTLMRLVLPLASAAQAASDCDVKSWPVER